MERIDIDKRWIETTDKLIKKAHELKLVTMNGDLLVAKQPIRKQTRGGIYMPGIESNLRSYFTGFGRIIQLPATGFASTSGTIPVPYEFKMGDFIAFTHNARYQLQSALVNLFFEEEIDSTEEAERSDLNAEYHDTSMFCMVAFPDVKIIKPAKDIIKQAE